MPDAAKVFAKNWHQNAGDSKMLCYDIEFKKWDDIDRDTIVTWQEIEGDWKVKQVNSEPILKSLAIRVSIRENQLRCHRS